MPLSYGNGAIFKVRRWEETTEAVRILFVRLAVVIGGKVQSTSFDLTAVVYIKLHNSLSTGNWISDDSTKERGKKESQQQDSTLFRKS